MTRLSESLMRRALAALFVVSLLAAGCGQGTQSDQPASEHGPPWVTLSDDEMSSNSSGPAWDKDNKPLVDGQGRSVLRFRSNNSELADLLEDIAWRFEASIVVRPQELAARGITIEVTGADAKAALEDLASQCKLELESLGDNKWRLAAPGSENAAEEAITLEDE